ncbi:hypothetical protein CsSME_00016310 [Camellia sinensis var. sinensis]
MAIWVCSKVIVQGDPHLGAIKGRMSFQSFKPSIDKLNEEARNLCQPEASTTCSGNQNGRMSDREDDANGELKRKQAEVVSKTQYPNK